MGASVATGVSVVGGLVGLNKQSSAAKAQRRAIEAQSKQAALTASLQLLQLQQQQEVNKLTDAVNDQVTSLQYQQASTSLEAQRKLNELAVANATYEAQVQGQLAQAQAGIRETSIQEQRLQEESAVRQSELGLMSSLSQEQQQQIAALTEAMAGRDKGASQLSNILDMAMASGGVNEALSVLFPQGNTDSAGFDRQEQRRQLVQGTGSNLAEAGLGAASARAASSLSLSNVQAMTEGEQARRAEADAVTSGKLADTAFDSAQTSLDAQRTIDNITDPVNRATRDKLAQEQEKALLQGANLQQDIAKAQIKGVSSPGFFDLVGVGLQGYNVYRSTGGKI